MKKEINFNKHAGVKEFVDFNAIYNAVENALESLDGSAEFKINNNYSLSEILKLAQKYHVSAIEVRGIDNEMSNERISDFMECQVEKTKNDLKEAGVYPLSLGTSCKFHDENTVEKNIENL